MTKKLSPQVWVLERDVPESTETPFRWSVLPGGVHRASHCTFPASPSPLRSHTLARTRERPSTISYFTVSVPVSIIMMFETKQNFDIPDVNQVLQRRTSNVTRSSSSLTCLSVDEFTAHAFGGRRLSSSTEGSRTKYLSSSTEGSRGHADRVTGVPPVRIYPAGEPIRYRRSCHRDSFFVEDRASILRVSRFGCRSRTWLLQTTGDNPPPSSAYLPFSRTWLLLGAVDAPPPPRAGEPRDTHARTQKWVHVRAGVAQGRGVDAGSEAAYRPVHVSPMYRFLGLLPEGDMFIVTAALDAT